MVAVVVVTGVLVALGIVVPGVEWEVFEVEEVVGSGQAGPWLSAHVDGTHHK